MTTRRRFLTGLSIGAVATTAGCSELQQMIRGQPIDDLDLEIADVRAPSIGLTSATIPTVMELKKHQRQCRAAITNYRHYCQRQR